MTRLLVSVSFDSVRVVGVAWPSPGVDAINTSALSPKTILVALGGKFDPRERETSEDILVAFILA